MFGAGVWPTMLTSHRAAPLLPEGGLIACTIAWAQGAYTGSAFYDAAKACIARFAFAMAHDLRERQVTAVAVAPGFMRTERVMAAHAENPFDLAQTESPEYLGRAIAHLAADPERQARTGELLDGRRPGARLRLHRRRRLAAGGVHDPRRDAQDRRARRRPSRAAAARGRVPPSTSSSAPGISRASASPWPSGKTGRRRRG